ncbi:efflux RND transporter permease subunit [Vibrio tapetis]|uniref:Putative Acriflavin resistance protein n=1 Tax=Vibrio tapetis subsp. tapetis TaxID=1671868 RepID=A0A2N8ZMY9_9VIBR|nr:efflux RND transporter permease subunit [Vibrio tapetis]SON53288.1 putative Acriflavin resistance protein [Vibrio tapetis subsp. tapetis]
MKKATNQGFVHKVMNSYLPPILIVLALVVGGISLWLTPKEEDPQIIVPMADVLIQAPGLSAKQVENQVTEPLEKLLSQIDGVEDVYSSSMENGAQVIVRYYVGESREGALIKLYNKIYSNQDKIPPSVTNWAIKPVEIDDVPIVVASLYSTQPDNISTYELRRIAQQATQRLKALDSTNIVKVFGGQPRIIEVALDPSAMASRMTTIDDLQNAFKLSHQKQSAGITHQAGNVFQLESGQFFNDASELGSLVVNVVNGKPVYLRDVALITDGPSEAENDTWYQKGSASGQVSETHPAVFLSVAKQKGSNAVSVAKDVLAELDTLKSEQLPEGVEIDIIRNYGQTADDKVSNLVSSLGISILTVVVFVGLFLNWRSALVVGIAIPISYGAALGMDLAFGYSINRVTLFALILALGLIVDDPIASIDNIERYLKRKDLSRTKAIVLAMAEIRSALLMSTVAIVIVFTPMFFITGMMGPYMAPLAFNVPISVVFSTVVAFMITPWLAKKILRSAQDQGEYNVQTTFLYKIYKKGLTPLLASRKKSWMFLGVVALLFISAAMLPAMRLVPLKLLPYDNKNEFQLVLNMPDDSSFVSTSNALRDFSAYLVNVPEVESVSAFSGLASPMDFNGMVRHYFMRSQPSQGELRIVLADKDRREMQSHGIVTRLRTDLEAIAPGYNAHIQLVEVPPGPPVIATLTAEVYGKETTSYERLQQQAKIVVDRLNREEFVSEVDSSVQGNTQVWQFVVDREKAALSGISVADINRTISAANQGFVLANLKAERELEPLPVSVRLPSNERDKLDSLLALYVRGQAGITKVSVNGALEDTPQPLVQISELGQFEVRDLDQPIYHKNLKPVVYVYAESVGRVPGEIIADVLSDQDRDTQPDHVRVPTSERTYFNNGAGDGWSVDKDIEVVWSGEGEWKITVDVFRDLGIAYGAALLGVFIVMLIQTGLPAVSGIIMLAIPLTVIGIMPGFWVLNMMGSDINGYPNPALFTATAMIGMIALAGIVVRNSLVLIEFIHQSLAEGKKLQDALIEAGAVRMRPILLTAGTTLLGNIVITLDPIFNGLAWSIIFGITASTVFTLAVIPIVYHLAYQNVEGHGLPVHKEEEA